MTWSPAVTVAAVIERDRQFLMVEERPAGVAVINQPAGHLEPGESLEDAIVREVMEETGRRFDPTALIGVYLWQLPTRETTYLRFCFVGHVSEPVDAAVIDPDVDACHWLTREQIARGPLPPRSPLVLRCIDDAAAGRTAGLELLQWLR
jgi:phosphatase NudJ